VHFVLQGSADSDFRMRVRRRNRASHDRRDDSGQVIFKHVVRRMKTAGYMWTNQHKRCQDAPVSTNLLCYLPDRTFARAITTLRSHPSSEHAIAPIAR